jgi:hypothetical protein
MRNDAKRRISMAATLNRRAYEHAINNGRFVFDERDVWSEHRPSAQKKTTSFASTAQYGKWYLGINDEKPATQKTPG